MIKRYKVGKPPSQTWRTFLKNHMNNTYAIDFFTVPTAKFKLLYVFVVLWHERRKVIYFNVTMNPTAQWTAQQITEACPWDAEPKNGLLVALPRVGGLHHRYEWKEAA